MSALFLSQLVNGTADPLLEGVGVSDLDGPVDWNQSAASGRVFAFARASIGLVPDSTFAANYTGVQAAGMIRGACLYFDPTQNPVAQANLLMSEIGSPRAGDFPPVRGRGAHGQ